MRQELSDRSLGTMPSPGHLVEAFNAALGAAEARIAAAASSPAAVWGWPPAECVNGRASLGIPAGWHEPRQQASLQQALRSLRLPPFPEQGHAATGRSFHPLPLYPERPISRIYATGELTMWADALADEAVASYLGHLQGPKSPASAGSLWHADLLEACVRRLLALDAAQLPAAVVLQQAAQSTASLPRARGLRWPVEPRQESGSPLKRKWDGSAGVPSAVVSRMTRLHDVLSQHGSAFASLQDFSGNTSGCQAATLQPRAVVGQALGSAPAWSSQDSPAVPLHGDQGGTSLDEVFADVPASTARSEGRQEAEQSQRLAQLQRSIDARMEREHAPG